MPSDLIYREDAKDYARHAIAKGPNVLEYLDEVPAADSRPVVRGKWIDYQQGRWVYAKCSECETVHDVRSNFCPNCGADMRPQPPKEG
jgi:hypothetical protein